MGDIAGGFTTGLASGAQGLIKYPELQLRKQEMDQQNILTKQSLGIQKQVADTGEASQKSIADYYARKMNVEEAGAPAEVAYKQALTQGALVQPAETAARTGQIKAATEGMQGQNELSKRLSDLQVERARLENIKTDAEAGKARFDEAKQSDLFALNLERGRIETERAKGELASMPSAAESKAMRSMARAHQINLDESMRKHDDMALQEHAAKLAGNYADMMGLHPGARQHYVEMVQKIATEGYAHLIQTDTAENASKKTNQMIRDTTGWFDSVNQHAQKMPGDLGARYLHAMTTGDIGGMVEAMTQADAGQSAPTAAPGQPGASAPAGASTPNAGERLMDKWRDRMYEKPTPGVYPPSIGTAEFWKTEKTPFGEFTGHPLDAGEKPPKGSKTMLLQSGLRLYLNPEDPGFDSWNTPIVGK